MEGAVEFKILIREQTLIFRSKFDHVDVAVAARNDKPTHWTTTSDICWTICLTTSSSAVTWTHRSSLPSVHTLQKWVINFQKINGFELTKVDVICVFQLFTKPLSTEKTYSNPSCFGVCFHSLVCEINDLRGRRCINNYFLLSVQRLFEILAVRTHSLCL
jgi:hypothetical protein